MDKAIAFLWAVFKVLALFDLDFFLLAMALFMVGGALANALGFRGGEDG